jgi:GNAT superfamily N-acetyltransferase
MTRQPAHIRLATLDDLDVLVAHRRAMFEEMGYSDQTALDAMAAAFRPWLRRKMDENEYLAWFALDQQQQIAAGLGLWLMDWPPHMIGPGARRGNILNVYTRPESRRRGLARNLIQYALEWCCENGIRAVILHASKDGRDLYQKLGFHSTNEMRLELKPEDGTL